MATALETRYANALRADDMGKGATPPLALLALILTQRQNSGRRKTQRATWLSHRWLQAAWRYVYIQAREPTDTSSGAQQLDVVVGDTVTLSKATEGYDRLVFKTFAALRWALTHVSFDALLKTDDDSMVHVGRASIWLTRHGDPLLYAGRVFRDSQVVRANFSRADLRHQEWFPADFGKWAVPFEAFTSPSGDFPPYCSGGGYFLGRTAAQRIVVAFNTRRKARRPVVRVEDAFVGILAAESNLTSIDISAMVQDPPAGLPQTKEVFAKQILVHRVAEPTRAFGWLVTAAADAGNASSCDYACRRQARAAKRLADKKGVARPSKQRPGATTQKPRRKTAASMQTGGKSRARRQPPPSPPPPRARRPKSVVTDVLSFITPTLSLNLKRAVNR